MSWEAGIRIDAKVLEEGKMPGTGLGLFLVDVVIRPFIRIYQKWPLSIILILLVVYGIIGYIVIRSAYLADRNP